MKRSHETLMRGAKSVLLLRP